MPAAVNSRSTPTGSPRVQHAAPVDRSCAPRCRRLWSETVHSRAASTERLLVDSARERHRDQADWLTGGATRAPGQPQLGSSMSPPVVGNFEKAPVASPDREDIGRRWRDPPCCEGRSAPQRGANGSRGGRSSMERRRGSENFGGGRGGIGSGGRRRPCKGRGALQRGARGPDVMRRSRRWAWATPR